MTCGPIAILGSGAAGVSLALSCAAADVATVIVEPDPHARERTQSFARKDDPQSAGQITYQDTLPDDVSLIFDALDLDERDIDAMTVPPNAACATPYATPFPGAQSTASVRCVPFQPMQLRHLTELTRFKDTSDQTLTRWQDLAQHIGRVPVILPPGTPSVGLRLQDRLHAAADHLLLQGAILWELDEAMTDFGFDLGFYEAQDLTGLDVAYARRKAQNTPSKIADRAVEEGRIGKKIGWGWYRYPGGGGAVIDPLIEDLIREEAWFAKVDQRGFSDAEVIEIILNTLRDELQAVRSEGQVTSSSDLAKIVMHGLGFPSDKLDLLGL